jgi:hypothetical protein
MPQDEDLLHNRAWVMDQLRRLDVRIESQYTQIHSRYTWFLVTQGFLFTAFAITLANVPPAELRPVWSVLFYFLPVMGVSSSIVAMRSVEAHKEWVEKLKPARKKLEEQGGQYDIAETEADPKSYVHIKGLMATEYTWVVMAFWVLCSAASILPHIF